MGRADQQTIDERVEAVRLLLLEGNEREKIARDIALRWGIQPRQARNYIAAAVEQIRGILEVDKAFRTAEAFAARREVRLLALKAGDLRLVSDILKDEAKLWGLYAPERAEVANTMTTEAQVRIYLPDNQRGDGPPHDDD